MELGSGLAPGLDGPCEHPPSLFPALCGWAAVLRVTRVGGTGRIAVRYSLLISKELKSHRYMYSFLHTVCNKDLTSAVEQQQQASKTMASSRWKRFAFFERQALNLPSEVLDDLIPSEDAGNAAGGSGGGRPPPSSGSRRSLRSLLSGQQQHSQQSSAMGDLVSLVVTTAALPASTRSSTSSGVVMTTDGRPVTASIGASRDDASASAADASSLDAMWCTLTACAEPSEAEDSGSRIPVIPLPSQAASAAAATAALATSGDVAPALSANPSGGGGGVAVVDGLVLAFVSSRETELVHCVDLTVRCNPSPHPSDSFPSSSAGRTEAPEELDGWRGYFSPFPLGGGQSHNNNKGPGAARDSVTAAHASAGANIAHGAAEDGGGLPPKVVGLACCRTSSRQVHLACLAETNVAVWVDPHLHLSCRRPISLPSRPADATTYVLPHELSDGRGCAVDVRPGIVAVGMDVRRRACLVSSLWALVWRNPLTNLHFAIPCHAFF
jgi:hypothetical protein